MRLFSYIMVRDFGFAPNPFYGVCTLATCKPKIRASAAVGDWVIGTGAKSSYRMAGRLMYAMQIDEILGFDAYWRDPRFMCKRPLLNGSLKQLYGDNIYHRRAGKWVQTDSHHSLRDGTPNFENVRNDTGTDRVLLGRRFVYYGAGAPLIAPQFRAHAPTGKDICCKARGHRVFSGSVPRALQQWLENQGSWGLRGMPIEMERHERVG